MEVDHLPSSRELERRIQRLTRELKRLGAEVQRLLADNRKLRDELTILRFRDEACQPEDSPDRPASRKLPAEAIDFYEQLPSRLSFAAYFYYAELSGITAETAREFMLMFIRKDLISQQGRRIEKRQRLGG